MPPPQGPALRYAGIGHNRLFPQNPVISPDILLTQTIQKTVKSRGVVLAYQCNQENKTVKSVQSQCNPRLSVFTGEAVPDIRTIVIWPDFYISIFLIKTQENTIRLHATNSIFERVERVVPEIKDDYPKGVY